MSVAEIGNSLVLLHDRHMAEIEEHLQGSRLPAVPLRSAIRKAAGVPAHELARMIGVSRYSLWRYETGKTEPRGVVRRSYSGALAAMQNLRGDE